MDADVLIVGGGQAGMAMAYCLRQQGLSSQIIDASQQAGDGWRSRYDSLKLFTPSQYCSLPGFRFPFPDDHYPAKDEVADYLDAYEERFELNVRHGSRVLGLRRDDGIFVLKTDSGDEIEARKVVVATGSAQFPHRPAFASELDAGVCQLHTADYKNADCLPSGRVLIVGAGNSGAQIAEELAPIRDVTIAYEKLPKQFPQRFLGRDIFWWFIRFGVMSRTKTSSRSDRDVLGAVPLIGTRLPALIKKGKVRRLPRVAGVEDKGVRFADDTLESFDVVIWATGFRNEFGWIDVEDALDAEKNPLHVRGVSPVSGLYFVGLPALHTKGSGFLGFMGKDAEYLAEQIAADVSA